MISDILIYAKNNGYFVDVDGNVFSRKKQLSLYKHKYADKYSLLQFSIYYQGKRVVIQAHKFIAYLKFGDDLFEEGIKVRHLDGDSLNNTWDNILIGTHSENMLDIPKEKRILKSIAAKKNSRRFTDEEVQQILDDRDSGFTYKMLCEKYDTIKSTLSYLFNSAYYAEARKVD